MEWVLQFETEVTLDELNRVLAEHNPGIFILRASKLTGTVKVRGEDRLSRRDIKRAFRPLKVKRIYDEFPLGRLKAAE